MGSRSMNTMLRAPFVKAWRWYAPPVPDDIRDRLQMAQLESVRRDVPMLLATAGVNVAIIMALCAHDGFAFASYGWMSLLLVYCIVRLFVWSRILDRPVDPARIPTILKWNVGVSVAMMSLLSLDSAYTFAVGMFNARLLIPVSLCFGAMAIAHCLYALRPAAIGVLAIGLFPSAAAMIFIGDFEAKMVGLSTMTVAVLMIRFVAAQYDRLIEGLYLEKQIRELADTDALTGLPNRRAMMAALETENGQDFAVALIDLDGFKQVNDRLGHHAGDRLLCVVAERLNSAAPASDLVGRLGGDEFIILFRGVVDENDVSARADALLASLLLPVEIDGEVPVFGASLGYAVSGIHGHTVEELLHSADAALYAAKRGRKSAEAKPGSPRIAA
jgi:diguanylate cyclase